MHSSNNKRWLFWWEHQKISAPIPGNGANNGVSSGETEENIAKVFLGLTIITDESLTTDLRMDILHVVKSESPSQINLSKFQQSEIKILMDTTVMDKWGCRIYVLIKRIHNILENIRSNINIQKNKERNKTKRPILERYQN